MKIGKYILIFLIALFEIALFGENVTVIGTSYVGLVTAAIFSKCGHHVSCLDVDREKIAQLKQQKLPIYEPNLAHTLFEPPFNERINFTSNIRTSYDSPIVYICVGTPTTVEGIFDNRFIYAAIDIVLSSYTNTKIICIKSTVQPGTNKKLKQYLAERKRDDINLVYNPEFMREGCAINDISTKNPLIIAGDSADSLKAIENLYKPLINDNAIQVIKTSFETAEIIKYGWNSFSALRIAYINELAFLCKECNADIFSVIKAIALSERLLPTEAINPGPGSGGSCLPKDTFSFTKTLEKKGLSNSLVHRAIISNKNHKKKIINNIFTLLNNKPDQKIVAILGLSFKAHTDDVRCSPAIDIIKALKNQGAIIHAYDPQAIKNMRKIFPDIDYFDSPYKAAENSDCIVVLTEWPELENLNLEIISNICAKKVLFDAKNLYDPHVAQECGFTFSNLGRV